MKDHLKRKLLISGIILNAFMLTACHTVEGTVQGAGQDVQAVTNTIAPEPQAQPPVHHRRHHRHHHHKKMMTKTANTTEQENNMDAQPTQQNGMNATQ